ncbi:dimethylarginine dimethylaminohydrolase family protein [Sphingomonas agri]|uniref:dimethylarginine dimethylaminohydrolase family protein n=1 Tax=Sphingomonas agri TaxID=1813878 RepID=UPI00311E5BAF
MPRAFTRAVSPLIAQCQLTHLERRPIDASKAALQHHSYEQALASAGYELVRLPELPSDPDAVFVEDTALILDGHAVITRPGAASRAGETKSTAAGLVHHFELHSIECGFLDGGDVLRIGRTLYVGLSTRTDHAGVQALSTLARPLGFSVVGAKLGACLHLKTGASLAGADGSGTLVLLYCGSSIDPTQFAGVEPVAVDADEPSAANCVRVGNRLVIPAGNPRTADLLGSRGFDVIEVDVSELQKAEAGVTCMSLIDDRA